MGIRFAIVIDIYCREREFNNIGGIIFDKDGTLENSAHYWLRVAIARADNINSRVLGTGRELLKIYGVEGNYLDPGGLMAVGSREVNITTSIDLLVREGIDRAIAGSMVREAFREVDRTLAPLPNPIYADAPEIIHELHAGGLKLAILSADTGSRIAAFVKHYKLNKYISAIVGSDGDVGKPDPEIYRRTCEYLGLAPENTLMVGDTVEDMEMARAAGAGGTIGIYRDGEPPGLTASADVVIGSLGEINF